MDEVGCRRKTRRIHLGSVPIGDGAPVVVQSMTNTETRDVEKTVNQIRRLARIGCEVVRVAVKDKEAAHVLSRIREKISLPLVADIHFDYRLALMAIEQGVEGIRINPGNMSGSRIREVVRAAQERGTVIRVGVNAGSLEKSIWVRYGGPCARALVESALSHVKRIEDMGWTQLKISVKSSHVPTMIEAYRMLADATDCPLHLGVTEAGTLLNATVKSAVGMGILLHEGIGDTIRVSITGDPTQEIPVAFGILRTLGLRLVGPEIVACPTCGRCEIDVAGLARKVEKRLLDFKTHLKIAIMGCVVNGPGEAKEADIGIAGGKGRGLLFKRGKVIGKLKEEEMLERLIREVYAMEKEREEKK
ncbi:MAG: flavodoxin-dependent (E)-4-hydroxy-3-methylbut-2-enyl-diphosphate synthase [Syntrophales bacterium]|nr:flavodoxin-dependent (E)-4-hydroxy-3-methylbut-2-enyl-diphosphate synthase [Syntrophales bacterium]